MSPVKTNPSVARTACAVRKPCFILLLSIWIAAATCIFAQENAPFPALEAGFIGEAVIYLTENANDAVPTKNELNLYIQSAASDNGKRPAAIPAKANLSYIKIYFEYGNGLGDLAPREDAASIDLSLVRSYGNSFKIDKRFEGILPHWKLIAKTETFLQGGSQNRLELKLSNIYSYADPGLTTLYIEYGHAENSPAGILSLAVIKRYPSEMVADQGLQVGGEGLKVDGPLRLQSGAAVNSVSDDTALKKASGSILPTANAVKTYVDQRLPAGVIVMWSGTTENIPEGWVLCDGDNDTPNLQDRFVLGAGKRDVSKTGGEETVVLTTDQMPTHTHGGTAEYDDTQPEFATKKIYHAWNSNQKFANSSKTEKKEATLSVDPTGKGEAHNNMPPYFVLAYIMKLP